MISWLHISDLHMKKGNDADQQNSCSTFLRACERAAYKLILWLPQVIFIIIGILATTQCRGSS